MPSPAREGCKKKSFARGPGRACVLEGRPATQRCQHQPLKGQRFGSVLEKFSHSWLLVQLCGVYKTFGGGGWDHGVENRNRFRRPVFSPSLCGVFFFPPCLCLPACTSRGIPLREDVQMMPGTKDDYSVPAENWLLHRFVYSLLLLPHLKSVLRWAMCQLNS